MRVLLISLLILCNHISCSAQASAVANLKQNVVYIGLHNPFIVVAEQQPCEAIFVTTDNGRLEQWEDACQYIYFPEKEGKATITIHSITNGDTTAIGKHGFRVKKLPDPTAKVAQKSSGSVSAAVLRVQSGIVASLIGFDVHARFPVMEYSVIAQKSSGMTISLSATGAFFTEPILELFNQLEPKDVVIFAGIKARGPDGRIRSLAPIELTIE